MHWLDFILIVILGIGALLGLRSGLLWQVARVVIFVAAIYGCIHFHDDVANLLHKNFEGLNDGVVVDAESGSAGEPLEGGGVNDSGHSFSPWSGKASHPRRHIRLTRGGGLP